MSENAKKVAPCIRNVDSASGWRLLKGVLVWHRLNELLALSAAQVWFG